MTLFTNFGRHFVFWSLDIFFRLNMPELWMYIVIRPEANGKFGAKHKLRSKPTMLCVAVVHSFIRVGFCIAVLTRHFRMVPSNSLKYFFLVFFGVRNGICMRWPTTTNNSTLAAFYICIFRLLQLLNEFQWDYSVLFLFLNFPRSTHECTTTT